MEEERQRSCKKNLYAKEPLNRNHGDQKQPRNREAKFCGLVVSYTVGFKEREQQSLLQQYTVTIFMLHVRLDSNY